MLEIAFVDWLVALLGDGAVRGVTRILLGNRERRDFAAALSVAGKAAIAAVLLDVPDEARDALERALSERFDLPPPSVLDGRTRVRTALIDAIRDQIAPLADPDITPSGNSFLEEIGVDAAWLRDELAQIAIGCIEQIGPNFRALTPLVVQLNADGILQFEEAVDGKIDKILAEIEQWKQQTPQVRDRAGSNLAGPPGSLYNFPPDTVDRIADALLEIPSMSDSETRGAILNMLPNPLRDSIPRSQIPRLQIYHIVQTSPRYTNGLRDLIGAIRSVERDSLPMLELDNIILEIGEMGDGTSAIGTSTGGSL